MAISNVRVQRRLKIRMRIRKRIRGTASKPRLSVYKSNTATYAQLIDDQLGRTLAAASSKKENQPHVKSMDKARQVGVTLAQQAMEKGIQEVVFDRSGYIYHGLVKAVAEGAREQGLKF